MGTNKLKRMNRFELLELMYRLVKENEELRRRCEKLESRNGVPEREKTSYPAPHSTASTWLDEDEHFRTRREEVMQRMMEQTIQPPPRKPVPPAAPVKKKEGADWCSGINLRQTSSFCFLSKTLQLFSQMRL